MAKTQEEVAFEMLSKLKGLGVWGEGNKDEILDLYAECLIATQGRRRVKGLEAAEVAPAFKPGFKQTPLPDPRTQAQVQNQAPQSPAAAPQAAPANPVHQQQQQVAQAYQPPQQNVQR